MIRPVEQASRPFDSVFLVPGGDAAAQRPLRVVVLAAGVLVHRLHQK